MAKTEQTFRTRSSANFVVRYTLDGPDAVRKRRCRDARAMAVPGMRRRGKDTPDYVVQVLYWAERALARYTAAPFHLVNPARDGRIQISIETLRAVGRASRKRMIILHRSLSPEVLALTVAHEVFHVAQYEYQRNGGRWRPAVIEGGAVFAEQFVTDVFYDTGPAARGRLRTYRRIVREPHRPLTVAAYDCGLFWAYIGHQYDAGRRAKDGRPRGPLLYRAVLERCAARGYSAVNIRAALAGKVPGTDLYRFRYDGPGPHATVLRADTLVGNFAMAACLEDIGFVPADRRFALLPEGLAEQMPADVAAVAGAKATPPRATEFHVVRPGAGIALRGDLGDFGSMFYGVELDASVRSVRVMLAATAPHRSLLLQVGLIDAEGRLVDIIRTDRSGFDRTIGLDRGPSRIERLVVVVTGVARSAEYELTVEPASPLPDLMLTSWNAPAGRELSWAPDPKNGMWQSPDVRCIGSVGTPGSIVATVRNLGGADLSRGEVRYFCQWADGMPAAAHWRPVRGSDDSPAVARLKRLPAGTARRLSVKVVWPQADRGRHLFVLAATRSSKDENIGNKAAVTRWPGG